MGKGRNDGSFGHKKHFGCQRDCGVFVPFTRIKPLHPKPSAPWAGMEGNPIQNLFSGDRITYILDDESDCQHGMVLKVKPDGKILISTVRQ